MAAKTILGHVRFWDPDRPEHARGAAACRFGGVLAFTEFLWPGREIDLESLCPEAEISVAAHTTRWVFRNFTMPMRSSVADRFHPGTRITNVTFVVGQDCLGRWLAVETHGLGGGVFTSRSAAVRYAATESGRSPDAVKVVGGHVRLAM